MGGGAVLETFIKENKNKSCRWEARARKVWFLFLSQHMVPQTIVSKKGIASSSSHSNNSLTWLMASVNIGGIVQQGCLEGEAVLLMTSCMNRDDNYWDMPFHLWNRGRHHYGCPEYDGNKDRRSKSSLCF